MSVNHRGSVTLVSLAFSERCCVANCINAFLEAGYRMAVAIGFAGASEGKEISMTSGLKIGVVGAGIVGVSTAEWLRRDGHDVILFDRLEPGSPDQTSYGNAGLLARTAVVPVSVPGLLRHVPSMLFDEDGPLFMRWSYLPKLLPWLVPFLRNGREERVREIAAALDTILGDSVDQHVALSHGTAAADYIETGNYAYIYKDRAGFEKDAFGFSIRRDLGAEWEEWDRAALLEQDPHLSEDAGFAVALKDHGWIRDPGAYTRALLDAFRKGGGIFRLGEVSDISPGAERPAVIVDGETAHFDHIVVASGVWSRRMAERLGHKVPLEAERGYHVVLKNPSHMPPIPYMMADAKFAVTPMDGGLRCAGLVEFGGIDAPASDAPLKIFERRIRRIYPSLTWEGTESWMGRRPSTPDSLPLIGPSGKAAGVWFAFGAQHVGLTSGPKTGRLIADMIAGRTPNMDMTPFATDRFDRA